MQQLRAQALSEWINDAGRSAPHLLDVREDWELALCHLPGVVHIPMQEIPARCNELDPDADIVVICHHGVRSMQVALFFERQGFSAVHNLVGGMAAWAEDVDPTTARY